MQCTFTSVKRGGVRFSCQNEASEKADPILVRQCNDYWEATLGDVQWLIGRDLCSTHARSIVELSRALVDGDFSRMEGVG